MKYLIILALLVVITGTAHAQKLSFPSTFISATIGNRNVYKTKAPLNVVKVYKDGNGFNQIVSDKTVYTINPKKGSFIRYKILDDSKNLRVLSGCIFDSVVATAPKVSYDTVDNMVTEVNGNTTTTKTVRTITVDTTAAATKHYIVFDSAGVGGADNPHDYVFKPEDASKLNPNTHYLASEMLVGKVLTIPLRIRNEYFNNNTASLQANFSLAYGFGWKMKIGNHPYRKHYITTVFYAAGISSQKYFKLMNDANGQVIKLENGADSVSAKTDQLALTYMAYGLAYEYYKFNIGVFAGKDIMFGANKDWVYQSRWWYGIGLGYDLFK